MTTQLDGTTMRLKSNFTSLKADCKKSSTSLLSIYAAQKIGSQTANPAIAHWRKEETLYLTAAAGTGMAEDVDGVRGDVDAAGTEAVGGGFGCDCDP